MKKQFYRFTLLGMTACLAFSACQSSTAVIPPSTPIETVTPASQAPPTPTNTVVPTPIPDIQSRWSYQTGGAIWGSPTLDQGVIYTGSDDGNLYALDAKTGQLKWKVVTTGILRSRPAVDQDLVFFASDDGYLYAVQADGGKPVWRTDIGNAEPREKREKLGTSPDPSGFDYYQSSPVVTEGQVFVGSLDGNVYALDAASGRIQWKFQTNDKVRATPAVKDGVVYVGSWDMYLYALDAGTGKLRWKTQLYGQVQSTALLSDGLVYCPSRKASVFALDAGNGDMKWEYFYGGNMWVESSPRLYNGVLYIGSSGSKIVVSLDSQTGKELSRFNSNAFHWSTPAVVEDILYIGGVGYQDSDKGGLYVFKLVDGKFAHPFQFHWLFNTSETLEADGNWSGVASSPVVAEGVIYFGGLDGRFYAVQVPG